MIRDVIRFREADSDLSVMDEWWSCDTYEGRLQSIVGFIRKHTGFPPSANMRPIREGVFRIGEDTTLDELKDLAAAIREKCVIDAFQINVDRRRRICHMLFDWYDRSEEKCFHLHKTYQFRISVMILIRLGQPPIFPSPQWFRHYLVEVSGSDPDAIKGAMVAVNRLKSDFDRRSYMLAMLSLMYADKVCRGMAK